MGGFSLFSALASGWDGYLELVVSYVELLIVYELWAGERLGLEKAVFRYRRAGRSISVSAVPYGPGTDIWRSCRYFGALFRAVDGLPGGTRRFVFFCDIGANHCRLRHLGWEKCGHGLTSRPRESASDGFLNELLVLFGYPSGSVSVLLGGELSLRYCSHRFVCLSGSHLGSSFSWSCPGPYYCVLVVLGCPDFFVLGCLEVLGFLGRLQEFGYTGKPQHNLLGMSGMGVFSLVLGFGRD